jgi:adenine C2-methylase RlmN of 23S rRNA A2503 and tRNA A37
MKWIYHHHVTDFAQMTDLGKALRAKLEAAREVRPPPVLFEKPSADGTHKWLLGMDGGQRDRDRVHPRQGPRHAVRVLAGRLR